LSTTATHSDEWHNIFDSVYLNGPGAQNTEVGVFNGYLTAASNYTQTNSNMTGIEMSATLYGTMTSGAGYNAFLSQTTNELTGTSLGVVGYNAQFINYNPAVGSTSQFTGFFNSPVSLPATSTTAAVTFTNSSASIGWASNTLVAGQIVTFTTTGTLPTGFATSTNYVVLATGLSSSAFEVAASPGGAAITAGSAGSGTQTGIVMGSYPTNDFAFYNKDPWAGTVTNGEVAVGTIAAPSTGQMLAIHGAGTGSAYEIISYNSANTIEFSVSDAGTAAFHSAGVFGGSGTSGEVEIFGSSGAVALQASASSAGTTIATLSQNSGTAYTIAGTSIPQTFSAANTFSSTLNLTGLTSDSGQSDATVCDVTGTGKIYYGSGTGGICLSTSTARFKTDIAPEREGLTQLMALHPMSFNYKPGHGYDPAKRYNGFIAEQMAPVLPELVGHDDLGLPNSVDLMGLVPILVQSVQQQQREIWELGAVCLLLALWCGGMTVVLVRRR
jgi:hypothetical protein